MNILADIDTAGPQARQKLLKSGDLVLGKVAAVVDDDINSGNLLLEASPELPVALIANEYLYGVAFIIFAGWFNINAEDLAARPEIIPPHFQAAAAINPDLQDADGFAFKPAEMPVINVEVMVPLPYPQAIFVRRKISSQRV